MKKEIGGYFELESYKKGYNYYNYSDFNSARNAFLFYVINKRITKIFLPYFLCDSITNVCKRYNVSYSYYHIDERMRPILNMVNIRDDELVYIVNYFGLLTNAEIICLKKLYRNILVDNVQCFYCKAVKNVPTIYSCRKYFGVPDGAYLSYFIKESFSLKKSSARDRMTHLIGRKEGLASDYYQKFIENELFLNNAPIEKMSMESDEILHNIDHSFVIKRRNQNFKILHQNLKSINLLEIRLNKGPFCYPLYVKDGKALRGYLIKNFIYVPKLWPNVIYKKNWCFEADLSDNLVPIPCDQRYSTKDMERICRMVLKYEKN